MLLAALVRLAVAVSDAPALFFADSWGYLAMAYSRWPVTVAPLRPSGYPLLLHLIAPFGPWLGWITAVQHLAGLGVMALVYVIVRRLSAQTGPAVAAAAVVGLDAYAIALEQYLLAEAFFTLAFTAAACLTVIGEPRPRRLACAGLLLAAGTLMRPVGLFAIPVWLVAITVLRASRRALAGAAAAVLVPLAAYCLAHAALTGTFGLTQSDGWFLYGRVAPLARCRPAGVPAVQRPLCPSQAALRGRGPAFFVFSHRSPAHRVFGPFSADPRRQGRSDGQLLDFSLRVIAARPSAYVSAVAGDFLRFFVPAAATTTTGDDAVLRLPAHPGRRWDDRRIRKRFVPSYRPPASAPPALAVYAGIVHTARWLLALSVLATLAYSFRRSAQAKRATVLLALGLALLIGAVAASGFALRYLLPSVPVIVAAGAVSATAAAGTARNRLRRS